MVILRILYEVTLVKVDIVTLKLLQTLLQIGSNAVRRPVVGLGGNDDLLVRLSQGRTDPALAGCVGPGGVDKIDPL